MLPKENRIINDSKIPFILKKGNLVNNEYLLARWNKNSLERNRFNVLVSSKLYKKAVDRNRLRRQMYEVIRHNQNKFRTAHHFDMVIIPKKAIIGIPYKIMEKNFLILISNMQ